MRVTIVALVMAAILSGIPSGYAVQPTYEGQFGNPEEPALRVVKWPVLGFRKFIIRVHDGLHSGIHKSPCAAAHEGASGAWSGAGVWADHTARGMVYAPLPPKQPLRHAQSYEEQALAFIDRVTAPPEKEEAVPEEAEVDEAEEEVQYLPFLVKERAVETAQRRYVPDRAAQRDRVRVGEGNLLKLAR